MSDYKRRPGVIQILLLYFSIMDDENKMSELEIFYHSNTEQFKKIFPDEFVDKFEWFIEFTDFYFGSYKKYLAEAKPALLDLMKRQNPDLRKITHPAMLNFMDSVCETNCTSMMFELEKMLREFRENVIASDKYPKLEEWRAYYCKPQEPKFMNNDDRKYYTYLSDEEWEKYRGKENRKLLIFHQWEEKRKVEYYDVVQPLILKYLPGLYDIEDDYWVLYAVCVRDLYEEWKILCEELEIIIDYDMPPESIELKSEDFQKAVSKYYRLRGRGVEAKRDERIYGKKIDKI